MKYNAFIMVAIGVFILGIFLVAFKPMILQSSYDAVSTTSVTLSNGDSVVAPGSGLDADIVATLYGIAQWVLPLGAVILFVVGFMKGTKQ